MQFTDLHMVDVQHPLRYEYLRAETASAWRPQEALSVAGAVSLIERVNRLRGGPATGEPLSFVVTTGDNTDNNCRAELDWFLTAMTGGRITPNTGDVTRYEGVHDSGLKLYWQPEDALRDDDKALGFPRIEGLSARRDPRGRQPRTGAALVLDLRQPRLASGRLLRGDGFFTDFALGGRKLMKLDSDAAGGTAVEDRGGGRRPEGRAVQGHAALADALPRHAAPSPRIRRRAPFTRQDWIRAHMRRRYAGAGPVGHGYTEANLGRGQALLHASG